MVIGPITVIELELDTINDPVIVVDPITFNEPVIIALPVNGNEEALATYDAVKAYDALVAFWV
jgi:hypothetical protein